MEKGHGVKAAIFGIAAHFHLLLYFQWQSVPFSGDPYHYPAAVSLLTTPIYALISFVRFFALQAGGQIFFISFGWQAPDAEKGFYFNRY